MDQVRRCELSLASEVGLLAHIRYLASAIVERAAGEARIMQAHASAGAVVVVAAARACSIVAMGKAVAEVMELKAQAYTGYGPAALLDGLLQGLLPLAQAYVMPLRKIKSAIYIANGHDDVGHSVISREVVLIIQQLRIAVKAYTGLDMFTLLRMVPDHVPLRREVHRQPKILETKLEQVPEPEPPALGNWKPLMAIVMQDAAVTRAANRLKERLALLRAQSSRVEPDGEDGQSVPCPPADIVLGDGSAIDRIEDPQPESDTQQENDQAHDDEESYSSFSDGTATDTDIDVDNSIAHRPGEPSAL